MDWHLENRDPGGTLIALEPAWQGGPTLRRGDEVLSDALCSGPAPRSLERARIAGRPCGDLREGHKTGRGRATDFRHGRSLGSTTLRHTEMKGRWFIWDSFSAHGDRCRWRAPYRHGSRALDADSHRNDHLGFRCCKDS